MRLFDLSVNSLSTVAEMFSLGWDEEGEVWEEEMLEECMMLLHDITMQVHIPDQLHLQL